MGSADAQDFCNQMMRKYNFKESAIEGINKCFTFVVRDWDSTSGGGLCWWPQFKGREPGTVGIKGKVELFTVQEEAAVHELSHAHLERLYVLGNFPTNKRVGYMMDAFHIEAGEPILGRYGPVRELLRLYKYGNDEWSGMADEEWPGGWNWIEIHGGICSFLMGDVNKLPPTFWWPPLGGIATIFQTQFNEPTLPPDDTPVYKTYLPILL